jgi:hypothetical protein
MRVINLTHGAGNGTDKACLMTASNMLIGKGELGDINDCVCLLLRRFIIITNDVMPIPLLRELYGPLVWEILGTRTDDPVVLQQRAFAFADWAVREIAPMALDAQGLHEAANKLRGLSAITDKESAQNAADAADAAYSARAAADAAAADARAARAARAAADAAAASAAATDAAYDVATDAAYAAHAARAAAADAARAAAADAAAHAVAHAAAYAVVHASDAAATDAIWCKCPEIIRRVAAIGDKRPVEICMGVEELADSLH